MAQAEEVTTLDFRTGSAGRWDVSHMDAVELTTDGMVIEQPGHWVMRRLEPLPHPVDIFEIDIVAPKGTEAILFWAESDEPDSDHTQLPFFVPGSLSPVTVTINPDYYPQWNDTSNNWGIRFNNAENIRLIEMRLRHLSLFERTQAMWNSFWHMDVFARYSINFLWGPLIVDNPISNSEMWNHMPPRGYSVFRFIYPIIALVVVIAGLFVALRRLNWRQCLAIVASTLAFFWILIDIRMSTEIIHYAHADLTQYALKPVGERTFRHMANIYDVLDRMKPTLLPEDKFAMLMPGEFLLESLVVYKTYPSLAIGDEVRQKELKTWFVYYADNVSINEDGYLVRDGETILAGPGKVIQRFNSRSYVFRTDS